ncbi:MAG: conjugal transfer protein TraH [Thermodesulfobacteriota bacterium]
MNSKYFRRFTALIAGLSLILAPTLAWAGFEDEMRGLFNSMTNISDGGYHMGMGRGVVAGPSVVIRNQRVRTDIINFTPPRFDGGCGGIDMFLGSFSFISAQQFIHLMQSIASNAQGYAFKLALSVMCPTCHQIITNLEKTVRDLNRIAGDSCRVAQGLVDTAADKLGISGLKQQMEDGPIAQAATAVGSAIDAFDGFLNKLDSGTATGKMRGYQIEELIGNVAWKVLKQNGYVSVAFNSNSNELAEALMSVTGTVVGVKDSDDQFAMPQITPFPPIIAFKDIMEGGSGVNELKKYSCNDTEKCLYPLQSPYTFKGLQKMVNEVLLGSDDMSLSSNSMVSQLLTNNGTLSEQGKQLVRIAPLHTTRLRNMAVCTMASGGIGALEQYAKEASGLIALEVLEKFLRDLLSSLHLAAGNITVNVDGKILREPLSAEYQQKLQKLTKEVQESHNVLYAAKQQTLEEIYGNSMKSCNTRNLVVRKGG